MYVLSRYSVFSMSETHSSRETLCKCGSFWSKFTTNSATAVLINRWYFDKFSILLFLRLPERIKAVFIIKMHLETIGYHMFWIMIEKSIIFNFLTFLSLLCQSRNEMSTIGSYLICKSIQKNNGSMNFQSKYRNRKLRSSTIRENMK